MISVQLFAFNKRRNSTKIPTGTGTTYNGELKEGFSVTSLGITFNLGITASAPVYNYCYIGALRRYYFITNWTYSGGLWTAICAVDVLGTYRNEIGVSYQYVSRAYSNYDPNIVDGMYITTPAEIERRSNALTPTEVYGASIGGSSGTIMMGVVGSSSGAVGAVTYYAMSFSTYAAFMNTMLSSISWAGISVSEVSEELQKALINPTQYIVNCMWIPVNFNSLTVGTGTTSLNLGWWTFTLSGTVRRISDISSAWITRQTEIEIPKHPQAAGRLTYMQCAPYSSYILKFLPFGVFEIDSTELYNKSHLGLLVDYNMLTGDAVLHVAAKEWTEIWNFENSFLVCESNVGVVLPVGQVSANIGNYKQALTAGLATGAAQMLEEVL